MRPVRLRSGRTLDDLPDSELRNLAAGCNPRSGTPRPASFLTEEFLIKDAICAGILRERQR